MKSLLEKAQERKPICHAINQTPGTWVYVYLANAYKTYLEEKRIKNENK